MFCTNDLLALGVQQALHAAGVNAPAQIAMVGYDDIWHATAASVPSACVLAVVRDVAADGGRSADPR